MNYLPQSAQRSQRTNILYFFFLCAPGVLCGLLIFLIKEDLLESLPKKVIIDLKKKLLILQGMSHTSTIIQESLFGNNKTGNAEFIFNLVL